MTWVKLSDEVLNRCPWCLHDSRNGTHGEIGEERDGVIPVCCSFETLMRYPAYSTRIVSIGRTDGRQDHSG